MRLPTYTNNNQTNNNFKHYRYGKTMEIPRQSPSSRTNPFVWQKHEAIEELKENEFKALYHEGNEDENKEYVKELQIDTDF